MAVDKKILEDCILEAADGDAEFAQVLRDRYAKNEAGAAKFIGGFMRNSDYTKGKQELAEQRKQFDGQTTQLTAARTALEAAEKEKNVILKDLAQHRVSTAKARELMTMLSEKYDLTDADLPGMSELIATAKTGKVVDNTPDIETRLAAFKTELKKEVEADFVRALMPELGSMAALPMIWQEIGREHLELTGKALSFTEQQEILNLARKDNKPLRDVWEEKYEVGGMTGLRMKKHEEGLKKQWQSDQETADAKRRQDEALNIVTPKQTELGDGAGISAAFKTRFRTFETDPNKQATPADGVPSLSVKPGEHVRQTGDRGPTGAQRAAAKFLEQRSGKKVA